MEIIKQHALYLYNNAKKKDNFELQNEAVELYESSLHLFAKLKGILIV